MTVAQRDPTRPWISVQRVQSPQAASLRHTKESVAIIGIGQHLNHAPTEVIGAQAPPIRLLHDRLEVIFSFKGGRPRPGIADGQVVRRSELIVGNLESLQPNLCGRHGGADRPDDYVIWIPSPGKPSLGLSGVETGRELSPNAE